MSHDAPRARPIMNPTCASLDPRSRYYGRFGLRGCNGRGTFGRWKYDREPETAWRVIPCPACKERR